MAGINDPYAILNRQTDLLKQKQKEEALKRSKDFGPKVRTGLDRAGGIFGGLGLDAYGGILRADSALNSILGFDDQSSKSLLAAEEMRKRAQQQYEKGLFGGGDRKDIPGGSRALFPFEKDIDRSFSNQEVLDALQQSGMFQYGPSDQSYDPRGGDKSFEFLNPKDDIYGYPVNLNVGDDSANIQNEIQRIKDGKKAEDFRSKEAKIIKEQGGVTNKDKGLIRSGEDITNFDEAYMGGVSAYMEALTGQVDEQMKKGQKPSKSNEELLEYYKKEFTNATGIKTDGKPDKKDALMAFGLALMQNKAGKGFNLGKMLKATGEAGEKAMPYLTKAKSEAKAAKLAAGKYALGQIAAGKSATAALAAERRTFARDIELKRMEYAADLEKAKLDGVEIKNTYFEEPMQGVKFQMGNVGGRLIFSGGSAAAATLSRAYNGSTKALNTMNVMRSEIQKIVDSGSPTGAIIAEKITDVLIGFGLKDAKISYGEDGVSPLEKSKALRDSLISEFKKLITQESGNGISEGDIERVEKMFAEIDLIGNPTDALFRLEQAAGIFRSKLQSIDPFIGMMSDSSYFATQSEADKSQKVLDSLIGVNTQFNVSDSGNSNTNMQIDVKS
tara:strand:+ start:3779 stop:5617 length:1839 start_codon:yes stop_codon:yes gene_type:complete